MRLILAKYGAFYEKTCVGRKNVVILQPQSGNAGHSNESRSVKTVAGKKEDNDLLPQDKQRKHRNEGVSLELRQGKNDRGKPRRTFRRFLDLKAGRTNKEDIYIKNI